MFNTDIVFINSQDTDEYDMYLDRLLYRVKHGKGVSFKEFKDFCQFLNNLDDFSIAMRMYTLSDQAISKGWHHHHHLF